MSDPLRRALRTLAQTFLGGLLTAYASSGLDAGGAVDLSALAKVLTAAAMATVISLLTLLHNWLEDTGKIPAVLKGG